ncbi:hypothetical protein BKA70DRAFT_753600 [Coprinopsis sp. MPI-PUGE-AT-0042]|nr:hypothetical protein BKA70DRAFT_753600 [Coprinopsis sp. MPI-PUGE-AT-0042]
MASPQLPRRVVVDDSDPLIRFEGGGWFSVDEAEDPRFGNFGGWGPTQSSSLHGTNSSAELSFTFDGSSARLWGLNNSATEPGVIDPTWECLIDGAKIEDTAPFSFAENNGLLCDWKDGTPGEHNLTVRANPQGQTFWVDRVDYVPSPNASVPNGSVISVPNNDNAIKLGNGWGPLGENANVTAGGATAEVEFVGTGISWIGYIPNQFARSPAMVEYSLNGGRSSKFPIKALTEKQPATDNYKFFQIGPLIPGPHRLFVKYYGGKHSTPLTLTNLLIEGGNFTSPLPGDRLIFDASKKGMSNRLVGIIVGSVVGGLAFIAATIIIAIFIRRRKSKDRARTTYTVRVPFDSVDDLPPHKNRGNNSTNSPTTPLLHNYPSPPMAINTASDGADIHHTDLGHGNLVGGGVAAAQPLRKGQLMLEARNQGPSGYTSSTATDSGVVLHEDSGVRMDAQGNRAELPPLYTVQ